MSSATASRELEQLARELAAAAEVRAALEAERQALETRDAGGLLAAVDRKGRAFGQAAEAARGRPVTWQADRRYAELTTLLRHCRRLNDENGALIRGQRRRVDAALAVLTGSDAERPTYGRDGAAATGVRRRGALGSA